MNDERPTWQRFGFKSQEDFTKFIEDTPNRFQRNAERLLNNESFKALVRKYDPVARKDD